MSASVQPGLAISVRPYEFNRGIGTLGPNEVHVWFLANSASSEDVPALRSILSAEESERAARFRFEEDRTQYVQTRGNLRRLLGSYLGIPAGEIAFSCSEHGKPSLSPPTEALEFNVSHTRGMAVLGFCRRCRIGVDVERIRTDFQTSEIAERFFSETERIALRNVAVEHRHEAFFRIWTRKEAYIKALGEGLSHPLHLFDVSLDETARLLATRPDPGEAQRWRLEDLGLPEGFVAAVAVELAGGSGEN